MKHVFLLLSLLLFQKECSPSKINQNNLVLEYITQSRGAYSCFIINKKTISKINRRGAKPKNKPCREADWGKIIKTLKTVDVENVPHFKAPSEKRLFDGAAIAKLKITYNGNVYQSQSFDHGNPPKEIAALVKEMLSISKNIE